MSSKEQMEKIIHENEKVFQLPVTFIFKPLKAWFSRNVAAHVNM
jgi:hypothetical protein